jgi:hypothetical protein
MSRLRPVVRLVLVVLVGAMALTDLMTAWVAWHWLDPSEVPVWAWLFWVSRGVLLAATCASLLRDGPAAPLLLAVVAVVVLAIWASPAGWMTPEDERRVWLAVVLLIGAGWLALGPDGDGASMEGTDPSVPSNGDDATGRA